VGGGCWQHEEYLSRYELVIMVLQLIAYLIVLRGRVQLPVVQSDPKHDMYVDFFLSRCNARARFLVTFQNKYAILEKNTKKHVVLVRLILNNSAFWHRVLLET
jgi:hypothetical protein